MSVDVAIAAFKIQGGTLRADANLCSTCRHLHKMRGSHSNQEVFRCNANYSKPLILREPMGECNQYLDVRQPSLDMMLEIAWSVMTDKGGRSIGFLSPEDLRERRSQPPTRGFGL